MAGPVARVLALVHERLVRAPDANAAVREGRPVETGSDPHELVVPDGAGAALAHPIPLVVEPRAGARCRIQVARVVAGVPGRIPLHHELVGRVRTDAVGRLAARDTPARARAVERPCGRVVAVLVIAAARACGQRDHQSQRAPKREAETDSLHFPSRQLLSGRPYSVPALA